MKRGEVYRFHYLWSHEAGRGEVSGRKIRRVCLMMQVGDWLYLFPITTKEPKPRKAGEERIFEIVPEIEGRRVGLRTDKNSHLILDDYNKVRVDALYDFESLEPTGSFSLKFLEKAARRFLLAVRSQRAAGVSRA